MKQIRLYLHTSLLASLILTFACLIFFFLEPFHFPVSYTAVDVFSANQTVANKSKDPLSPLVLTIPSINVVAKIESVGLTQSETGEMAPPSNFSNVAWFKDGTIPGHNGSAVIAGHLSGKLLPEAVFYNLSDLVIGDLLFITTEAGSILTFKVVAVKVFKYNDSTEEVFLGNEENARLNLITCAGSWIPEISLFAERTVVFSELVKTVR